MEGEAGNVGDERRLLRKDGRRGDAKAGKLQAGPVKERADHVAKIDEAHVPDREGFVQKADGAGIETELEVYDSEKAKRKEQTADDGDLDAHQGRSAYADEYPCPDGTDELGDQWPPRMINFSHLLSSEKHTSPALPRAYMGKSAVPDQLSARPGGSGAFRQDISLALTL